MGWVARAACSSSTLTGRRPPPGLVTFLSFLLFGSVPLWGYVIFQVADVDNKDTMFAIACVLAACTMFALGAVKVRTGLWAVLCRRCSAALLHAARRRACRDGWPPHRSRSQARFTKQSKLKSGGMMLLNGTIAASTAYLVGFGLEKALGITTAD